MKERHQGKAVIITGGASGIGAAIAALYCKEGASVGIIDRNADQLDQRKSELALQGYSVEAECADGRDYAQCEAAWRSLVPVIGDVDILVCNAGVSPKKEGRGIPFHQLPLDEWKDVIDVNLNGTFNFARIVAPGMVERRNGRIICTSSVAG